MFTKRDVINWIIENDALSSEVDDDIPYWLEIRKHRRLGLISTAFDSDIENIFDGYFNSVLDIPYSDLPDKSYSIEEILEKL